MRHRATETEKGAVLELEAENGNTTGCVLYTARSKLGGDDHFHYEVCADGRGCSQAKVRVEVACSYFDRYVGPGVWTC